MKVEYTQEYKKIFGGVLGGQLYDINCYIKYSWNLLENEDIDSLYKKCQYWTLNAITYQLLNADINPLDYVTEIYPRMFYGLSVNKVDLPSRITDVRLGAFSDCSSLKNINLGVVETIGDNAFSNCINLEEIKIPKTIRDIGREVFAGCENLTKLYLPEKLNFLDWELCLMFGVEGADTNKIKEEYPKLEIIRY